MVVVAAQRTAIVYNMCVVSQCWFNKIRSTEIGENGQKNEICIHIGNIVYWAHRVPHLWTKSKTEKRERWRNTVQLLTVLAHTWNFKHSRTSISNDSVTERVRAYKILASVRTFKRVLGFFGYFSLENEMNDAVGCNAMTVRLMSKWFTLLQMNVLCVETEYHKPYSFMFMYFTTERKTNIFHWKRTYATCASAHEFYLLVWCMHGGLIHNRPFLFFFFRFSMEFLESNA